jgi:hypothetical protein
LLTDAAAVHDLTVTCDLLFLRFADRAISIGAVDGTIQQRLIEQPAADQYAIIDRYAPADGSANPAGQYTVTLLSAQYLGAHSFDRDGLRLTFGPLSGGRIFVQRLTRRADRLAEAIQTEPSLNLQRGCRCIEYGVAPRPELVTLTSLLEAAEPIDVPYIDNQSEVTS